MLIIGHAMNKRSTRTDFQETKQNKKHNFQNKRLSHKTVLTIEAIWFACSISMVLSIVYMLKSEYHTFALQTSGIQPFFC
jgi:hypothetical protein